MEVKEEANKSKNILIKIIVTLLVIVGIVFCLYVYEVTIYFEKTDEKYFANVEGVDTVISFEEDGNMSMYMFSLAEDETPYQFGKAEYFYSGYEWKHFFGPFYFSRNNLFSIKKVENDVENATIAIQCNDVKMYDWFFNQLEAPDMIGARDKVDISYSENILVLAGNTYSKIEDFQEYMKDYIEFIARG